MAVRTTTSAVRTWRGHPWLTLLVVAAGVMMTDLNLTIVTIANPVIGRELDASLADVQWITNSYLLALAISLIPAGRMGDRFGHRRVFLIGAAGFTLSATAIGLTSDIHVIIALRIVQGLSGALLLPAALGLLRATFPRQQLTTAIGVYGTVIGASTAAGPIVGGVLVEQIGWEAVFLVNAPIGAAILAAGPLVLLKLHAARTRATFDFLGLTTLTGAMFCLVWPLINAESLRDGHVLTWMFPVAFVILVALFVLVESKVTEPLLPLRMFRSVPVAAGTALVTLMAFALVGGLFFLTFYLQNVRNLDTIDTGWRLLPVTAVMIVASPTASQVIKRIGPRIPMVTGMLLTASALGGLATLAADTPATVTSGWFAVLGLGLAPVIVGATDVIVGNVPVDLAGVASGVQQSALQIGGSLGTAVLGAVMTATVASELPRTWAAAGLPQLGPGELDDAVGVVAVGDVPLVANAPPGAGRATDAVHEVFLSGMGTTFATAAAVALVGAGLALLVPGRGTAQPASGQTPALTGDHPHDDGDNAR